MADRFKSSLPDIPVDRRDQMCTMPCCVFQVPSAQWPMENCNQLCQRNMLAMLNFIFGPAIGKHITIILTRGIIVSFCMLCLFAIVLARPYARMGRPCLYVRCRIFLWP